LELNRLIELSSFLKKYKYLDQSYNFSNIDISTILLHYKKGIQLLYIKKIRAEDLKNEIIFLIFVCFHNNNISQVNASRIWSLICKNLFLKIFKQNLINEYPLYKKYIFIVGMGKIGVKDLNFTSDIDVIIFFDSKNSPYNIHDFNQSVKKLISDLSNISLNFFHKIDLRLRPDLGNSYIITDIENAIEYYSSVGRNWERLAFHRSQFMGGNILLYDDFISSIRSFLFRRSFDYYAIDEIKNLFSQSLTNTSLDIKNSFGYIRSCENIIHFNQLLWSGKFVDLRENNIHKIFKILSNYNFLSQEDLITIKDAYYFYRKIENYLHIKQNTFQNNVSKNDDFLSIIDPNYYDQLVEKSINIQNIFKKLFDNQTITKDIKLEEFNKKSNEIIIKLIERAKNINSSNSVKDDYLKSIYHLIDLLSQNKNKDELLIKFDYLINYYKSGVHLTSLYKYNQHLFKEIIFIFDQSPKLTNLLQKNNFLIESLVYFFNYGLPNFCLREPTENFDLDLKKIIQDIYESIFLLDYLYLSKKISIKIYLKRRNRDISKFIFNLFQFVKIDYLNNKPDIYSDLTPILFGSLATKQAISSSDADIFFIYSNAENNHIDNIKIVRRFYNIFNQYIDRNFISIDDRNKPFDKTSDQVISLKNFFNFYKNTNEIFHILSFQKIQILSPSLQLTKIFYKNKKTVVSQHIKPDIDYLKKMIVIKNPLEDIKDLFQIYKICFEINLINNREFKQQKRLEDIRESIISGDLTSSPSNINKKLYLDELLKDLF